MKAVFMIIAMTTALYGQQDHVEIVTDSGRIIPATRIDLETLYLLPKPKELNVFIEPSQILEVWGDAIYVSEAALYEMRILLVINPWADKKPSHLGPDVLALKPFDFLDMDGFAMGWPPASTFEYFDIKETWLKSEHQDLSRTIDDWQCDSTHHDTAPHPTGADPDSPCHAEVGADGNCHRNGENNATGAIYCNTRLNAQGNLEEECNAIISCGGENDGLLNGGPQTTKRVKCSSRTGNNSFMIGATEDGGIQIKCDNATYTLNCL